MGIPHNEQIEKLAKEIGIDCPRKRAIDANLSGIHLRPFGRGDDPILYPQIKEDEYAIFAFYRWFLFPVRTWRPKERSKEAVTRTKADRRFDRLVKSMKKGKQIDDLPVASVWMKDESTGEFIRSMTSDGVEAKPKPGDSDFTRAYTKPVRGIC